MSNVANVRIISPVLYNRSFTFRYTTIFIGNTHFAQNNFMLYFPLHIYTKFALNKYSRQSYNGIASV